MLQISDAQLVGREPELATVAARLDQRRLVTLTGPGGVGKTALARAAAARHARGWRFADLARVDSADAVGAEVARQFGARTLDQLRDLPAQQPLLLVVDNCEHVLDAASEAIAALLDAFDELCVLATSRAPLDLPGESIIALGPLDIDAASRLFVERATDAGANVTADVVAVAELCEALDCLPLAIEIAAARARTLTPTEILARLADPATLARPRHRGSDRHRSVRAAVQWSYEQLDVAHRRFFDRLAVIHGWFDEPTAHAVAGVPGDVAASRAAIDTLVQASLLLAEPQRGRMRYRQLATLRSVAAEHLEHGTAAAASRERFHQHLAAWALDYLVRAETVGEAELTDELLSMYDHIADALRWTVATDKRPERSMVLLGASYALLWGAHAGEIGGLGQRVLARWSAAEPVPLALATSTVAQCEFLLGHIDAARALAARALPAARGCGLAVTRLQRLLADTAWTIGDRAGARAAFEAMGAEARAGGMLAIALAAETWAAFARVWSGEREAGLTALRSVRAEAAGRGLTTAELRAMNAEAYAIVRDDQRAAERIALDLHERSAQVGVIIGLDSGLELLSVTAIERGDYVTAARHLRRLIGSLVERGETHMLRAAFSSTAALLERVGDPAWQALAATARSLPVLALCATPGHEPLTAPTTGAPPLPLREAITTALARLALVVDGQPALPGAEAPCAVGRFVREGDHWRVEFAGSSATARDSKGMRDLAYLLGRPGKEVHCLELAGAAVDESPIGDAIDAAGRQRYEERIRDLQVEIDTAEADNDFARAERAHAEFDAILEQLAAGLGLGGRARGRAGTTAERARSAVTQRIRAAIKRLASVHPQLGRHLDIAVTTGTFCVYRPERAVDWQTDTRGGDRAVSS